MLLTNHDLAQRAKYDAAKPKQGGNLHERMKYLISICNIYQCWKNDEIWQALFGLQEEVSFHAPANPPFGTRTRPLTTSSNQDNTTKVAT